MKNTACSHAMVPAGWRAHFPCPNPGLATSKRIRIELDAVSMNLKRHAEDASEAKHWRHAEQLLNLLHLVSGHHDLVAGHEVDGVRGLAFVDGRDVHRDRGHQARGLPSQNDNPAAVDR